MQKHHVKVDPNAYEHIDNLGTLKCWHRSDNLLRGRGTMEALMCSYGQLQWLIHALGLPLTACDAVGKRRTQRAGRMRSDTSLWEMGGTGHAP